MGDTENGSWGSRELGGFIRREEARKEAASRDGIFYKFEEKLKKFHRRGRIASVGHGMLGLMVYTTYTLRLHRRKVLLGQVAFQLHTIKAETLSMMEVVKRKDPMKLDCGHSAYAFLFGRCTDCSSAARS